MTTHQFSLAVNADEKWIENTGRLLKLRLSRTRAEALWLGLVQVLSREIGVPLERSAVLAREALGHSPSERHIALGANASGSAAITVDLARYHSSHIAALSAALILAGPRRRGRESKVPTSNSQALSRAENYGVDLGSLRDGLGDSPAQRLDRLEANAGFIRAIRDR